MPDRPTKIWALHDLLKKSRPTHLPDQPDALKKQDISAVSLRASAAYLRRGYKAFSVTLKNMEDILNPLLKVNPAIELSEEFRDYADVFFPKKAERLPPHRLYNHKIKLEKEIKLEYYSFYYITTKEL